MKKFIIYTALFIYSVNIHAQNTDSLTLKVAGLCDMCKERIENASLSSPGVIKANWNDETKILNLTYHTDHFSESKLNSAINKVGHDTETSKAPDEIYEQLHSCCKYRDLTEKKSTESHHKNNSQVVGVLIEKEAHKEAAPLVGANVYWVGTSVGVTSNLKGEFTIPRIDGNNKIVISYLGYKNDTLYVGQIDSLTITLNRGLEINEVVVEARMRSSNYSSLDAIKVQHINQGELFKAACCNLSESFETNPNVDVGITDAVTGTRTIEMLGLAGPYIQLMRENIPSIRGLAAINGLTYTPGSWIQGMQLNLGSGSVVNGFESITGQINVELKKPDNEELLFVNLYTNNNTRMEANLNTSIHVSEHIGTSVLFSTNQSKQANDHNNDGFLDHPIGESYLFLNRWKYSGNNGLHGQVGIKATFDDKISGQHSGLKPLQLYPELWTASQNTNRLEGWLKTGKAFQKRPERSIGFQLSATYHDQDANFNRNIYNAAQKSIYANLIFQDMIFNQSNTIKTGISFIRDAMTEQTITGNFNRNELIPGAFLEYSYVDNKFTVVAGLRSDYHNNFGAFITPRLNLKYHVTDDFILRSNLAKGYRTANIFAENTAMFATARTIIINHNTNETPYGLSQEEAWNFGLNAVYNFNMFSNPASFSFDLYRVSFVSQVVIDYEHNPQEVQIYSSDNNSFSNSLQTQLNISPFQRFDVRLAYRYNDAQTWYNEIGLLEKALSAKNRAFVNLAYETNKQLKIDYTINWIGKKRIPSTAQNPIEYRLGEYSDPFLLSHAQISKTFKSGLDFYIGGENLFGFTQPNAIVAANDPMSDYFDASMIWGPVNGRKFYIGLRYTLKHKDDEHHH